MFVIHLVRYEDNKNNKNTIMIVFCLHFVLFLFFEIANNPDVSMEHNKNSRTVVCRRKVQENTKIAIHWSLGPLAIGMFTIKRGEGAVARVRLPRDIFL